MRASICGRISETFNVDSQADNYTRPVGASISRPVGLSSGEVCGCSLPGTIVQMMPSSFAMIAMSVAVNQLSTPRA